jgi:hypothetical protein
MAIGSEPEIGKTFLRFGLMTEEQQRLWYDHFRKIAGKDLQGGFATLGYPKRRNETNGSQPV